MNRVLILLAAVVLLLAACGDDGGTAGDGDENPGTSEATDPPATDPPATDPPEPAIDTSGDVLVVNWDAVADTYIPGAGSADDPFFHIHSNTASDGFFLGFELYTVYGAGWTGQTGTFDIDCGGTGICVHFSVGDGPDVGADFLAAGQLTINQLDDDGYDIDVTGLMFTDGTVIEDLTLVG